MAEVPPFDDQDLPGWVERVLRDTPDPRALRAALGAIPDAQWPAAVEQLRPALQTAAEGPGLPRDERAQHWRNLEAVQAEDEDRRQRRVGI